MKNKTNIILVLTDDQGAWAMHCAGNSELKTPNLDKLAERGMRFENFFCTSPVCSPARASLLTGRIPSQHGVHDWILAGDTIAKYEQDRNGELIEYLKGQPGYTDYLAEAGYYCGISGKWHLGDSHHPQKGFKYWEVHTKGGGPYYNAPMVKGEGTYEEPEYVTDKITDNALEFLNEAKEQNNPFYLSVHYTAPHSPWGREHHPKELYDDYYNNCKFESVPEGVKPPEWVSPKSIRQRDRRTDLTGYFTAITAMDANVGRIIDWVEQNNFTDDTLIIFSSDNGMCMGHHGLWGKGNACFPINMFEESVKVPFIISHPGRIKEGVVNDSLLSQYDFMPTILEYVGLEQPESEIDLPGSSFVDILQGAERAPHEDVVVFDEYGPVRMVRTKVFKYIHRYVYGPNELYDLKNDPSEMANLIDQPEYKKIQENMWQRLSDWFRHYVDPERDGALEAVAGKGQLGLCGAQAKGEENFVQQNWPISY